MRTGHGPERSFLSAVLWVWSTPPQPLCFFPWLGARGRIKERFFWGVLCQVIGTPSVISKPAGRCVQRLVVTVVTPVTPWRRIGERDVLFTSCTSLLTL